MKALLRWLLLVLLAGLALQLYFVARIGMMRWVDPQSTAFQRSEAWRIVSTTGRLPWRQEWVPYERIADSLKRAVLASEDDVFPTHGGIYWESIEKCVEPDRILSAMKSAGLRSAERHRTMGIFNEYVATTAR